jgi:hypothetical protein
MRSHPEGVRVWKRATSYHRGKAQQAQNNAAVKPKYAPWTNERCSNWPIQLRHHFLQQLKSARRNTRKPQDHCPEAFFLRAAFSEVR